MISAPFDKKLAVCLLTGTLAGVGCGRTTEIAVDAGPVVCSEGLELCDGICVEVAKDRFNCGDCGNVCETGEICNGSGTCALSCQDGLVECSESCINPMSDQNYCGAGADCTANPGTACASNEACVDGACRALFRCHDNDVFQDGGCLLATVCNRPVQEVFGSGNCSNNTAEFAHWWCQLGGYSGALSYIEVASDAFPSHYYNGGEDQVLSVCGQVTNGSYGYNAGCTGVKDLVCAPSHIHNDLRPNLMLCGNSSRDVTTFIPDGVELALVESCTPDADTQALLVERTGQGSLDGPTLRAYLNAGGVVLTEYGNSHEVWSLVLPDVTQGTYNSGCYDNAPTDVQFTPEDPFWAFNPYQVPPVGQSGCGHAVTDYPFLTPLAGWAADQVGIGYRNIGQGRFWATDFDWQDTAPEQTDYTRSLLGYMITHRR